MFLKKKSLKWKMKQSHLQHLNIFQGHFMIDILMQILDLLKEYHNLLS